MSSKRFVVHNYDTGKDEIVTPPGKSPIEFPDNNLNDKLDQIAFNSNGRYFYPETKKELLTLIQSECNKAIDEARAKWWGDLWTISETTSIGNGKKAGVWDMSDLEDFLQL